MNPRQATAYLKGIRAARTYDIRSGQKPPVCPYERQSLANYWRRGYSDYFEHYEDAMHFLKHANGDY
tara:strand:- start:34576 stop:34776 length:201 start_codon:yes stop_codon:yes gene_type:complete